MYKLAFYVPESHLEQVKQAIFAAGAGRMGDYDFCAWQTLGQGQFRPLPGADPHIGSVNNLEHVQEYKVETVCSDESVRAIIDALREAHPYEEPAYDLIQLVIF
jgi:hypothetical protein